MQVCNVPGTDRVQALDDIVMTFTCCLSFPSIQDAYGISLAGGLQPEQPKTLDLQIFPGNQSQEKQRNGLRAEPTFSLIRHKHREPDWECGEPALGTAPPDQSRLRRFDPVSHISCGA